MLVPKDNEPIDCKKLKDCIIVNLLENWYRLCKEHTYTDEELKCYPIKYDSKINTVTWLMK